MKKLQGYISSRKMSGSFTPQRVQNLVIRDYCDRIGVQFVLSATEYYMENCFLILKALQTENEKIDGVVLYSMDLLPNQKIKIKEILNDFLRNKKEIHFALENLSIKSTDDLEEIFDIILIKELRKTELYLA